MSAYQTDEEQLEKIKEWWNNYGKMTVAAIIIAAIASFGWRYWQNTKIRTGQQASNLYEQMLVAQGDQKTDLVNQIALKLFKDYTQTPYANLAQLIIVKQDVAHNELAKAAEKLKWVMQHATSSQLRQIARLRLARVLIAQKQYRDASKVLETIEDKAYQGAIDEVKGDLYAAQNKKKLARKQYKLALKQLPKDNGNYALVQMKRNDLAP